MYMRLATLIPIAALAAVAAAAPNALEARFGGSSTSECSGGYIYCCSQSLSQSQFEDSYGGLLEALGIDLSNYQGLVGYECTGSTVCDQQPVCCSDNSFNGLVTVGCSPITING